MTNWELIFTIGILICGIILGYTGNELYHSYIGGTIAGLYMDDKTMNITSWKEAISKAEYYNSAGDWVCVNVKGIQYDEAVKICNHEVGHEIYAEYCENNIDKCMEMTK